MSNKHSSSRAQRGAQTGQSNAMGDETGSSGRETEAEATPRRAKGQGKKPGLVLRGEITIGV